MFVFKQCIVDISELWGYTTHDLYSSPSFPKVYDGVALLALLFLVRFLSFTNGVMRVFFSFFFIPLNCYSCDSLHPYDGCRLVPVLRFIQSEP